MKVADILDSRKKRDSGNDVVRQQKYLRQLRFKVVQKGFTPLSKT